MKFELEKADMQEIAEMVASLMTPHIEQLKNLASFLNQTKEYPRYLTERQVEELTGISRRTLQIHRFKRKGLPYIKVRRLVRYSFDDVVNYLESRKITFDQD